MVKRWSTLLAAALAATTFGLSAKAEPETPADPSKSSDPPREAGTAPEPVPAPVTPPSTPKVHHAPLATARAHESFSVRADIEHPELVKRALLVFRTAGREGLREVELLRASSGPYVAEVPAEDVVWPSLAYAIELDLLSGKRSAAFASRSELHEVQVPEDLMDIRERALSQRLGGRRSVFAATGEVVSFGTSQAQKLNAPGTESVNDYYYRAEGSYTYRPLRVVTEFAIRIGLVRGKSPVPSRELLPDQSESERYDVGLNYAAPMVRFRLHDQVHLQTELLGSMTEVGFAGGGGGALLLGDPYGTKLTLGFESIGTFGNRFYSRMDVVATERVTVAPMIEITNMPSADTYGVRLLGEVALDAGGGFSLALRGGYQARLATSGGPSGGAAVSYAF